MTWTSAGSLHIQNKIHWIIAMFDINQFVHSLSPPSPSFHHIPLHLIQTHKELFHLGMRCTRLSTTSSTHPSTSNATKCSLQGKKILREVKVRVEWQITSPDPSSDHQFYPEAQSCAKPNITNLLPKLNIFVCVPKLDLLCLDETLQGT